MLDPIPTNWQSFRGSVAVAMRGRSFAAVVDMGWFGGRQYLWSRHRCCTGGCGPVLCRIAADPDH